MKIINVNMHHNVNDENNMILVNITGQTTNI